MSFWHFFILKYADDGLICLYDIIYVIAFFAGRFGRVKGKSRLLSNQKRPFAMSTIRNTRAPRGLPPRLANYESSVVRQARRVAAGQSTKPPSREHLRVLLRWLDAHATRPYGAVLH